MTINDDNYDDNYNKTTIRSLHGIFFQEIYKNDDLNLRKEIKPVERVLSDGEMKWVPHFHR